MLTGGTTCRRPIIAGLAGSLLRTDIQKSTNGEAPRQQLFLSILLRLGFPCTPPPTTQTSILICSGSPSGAACPTKDFQLQPSGNRLAASSTILNTFCLTVLCSLV